MALFRKFFYRKPPDGLLEISESVYVFDCCFTTDVMEEDEYKVYIGGIAGQLRDQFPDASFMVFNFRDGEHQSLLSNILSEHDMTVMDYPRHYEGCPLLTMEAIHHCLRSSESWLSLGQQNVLLMHCERGGWLVLAFMLAALLIYRKQYTEEHKTLDMIYKQAPRELLQLMPPLNPMPSQQREETFDTFPTKLNPKTVVHNWLGSGVCPKAVAKGFRCIFSNQGVWYLDHLDVPWNVTYNAEPLEGITDISQQKLVIGGEVCMWGEKADTSDVQQTIWPRAAAAAERLWSRREATSGGKNIATALPRLQYFRCLLNRRGVQAAPVTNFYARSPPTWSGSCYDQ